MRRKKSDIAIFSSPYRRYNVGSKEKDRSSKSAKSLSQIELNSDFVNTEKGNIFYDSPGSSVRSTQQVNLDYSKFENHTFFDSATSKTNIAIDRVINEFPYDGTKEEFTNYMSERTGFEKYVFDNFNKAYGYLNFSTSLPGASDRHIPVKDIAGNLYPSLSKDNSGKSVLSPNKSPFTLEFIIKPEEIVNDNQVICQFSGSRSTISVFLSESSSTTTCDLHFHVLSGTMHSFVSSSIRKDKFSHIALACPRNVTNSELNVADQQKLLLYIDGKLSDKSIQKISFDELIMTDTSGPTSFLIGSGSTMYTPELESNTNFFVPTTTFTGSLDEFRFYHRLKTKTEIVDGMRKNVFNEDSLKLYFKFNEIIQDSTAIRNLVIDSSGNSLHSKITSYSTSPQIRVVQTGSANTFQHIPYEQSDLNTVLFMSDTINSNLANNLLTSASLYDTANPNLITNLVPGHYFEEGKTYEGLANVTGSLSDTYTMTSIPGSGKLGTGQVLTSFLLIWAKHFDELKIYIDAMSRIHSYGLQEYDVIIDNFLTETARKYGLELPSLFSNVDSKVFNEKAKIGSDRSLSDLSLQSVQNKIWKRILTNYKSILSQKGTISSIKQLIRSVGLDPDKYFNIREFGGTKRFYLEGLREKNIVKSINVLDFSGSIGALHDDDTTRNYQGFAEGSNGIGGSPYITSSFLVDSKFREAGSESGLFFPNVGSTATGRDRFLTSGSFTYEGVYKFDKSLSHSLTQSLCRICVTGSTSPSNRHGLLANLLAIKDNNLTGSSDKLRLYVDPSDTTAANKKLLTINLDNINIFNGKTWYISFGRIRFDDTFFYKEKNYNLDMQPMSLTSSYFLRCAEVGNNYSTFYATSSYFAVKASSIQNRFETQASSNRDGPFLVIGSQSIRLDSSGDLLGLNNNSYDKEVRSTNFSGKINFIRFYSNSLTENEAKEHARNPFSYGTIDPEVKFGHIDSNKPLLGAFNKIRLRANIAEQYTTASDSNGNIRIFDFSQNNYHFKGSGFEANKRILKKEPIVFSRISPKFAELQSSDKVRVRGYQDPNKVSDHPWSSRGSVFSIPESKRYLDDPRISIETGVVKSLDENIIKMISSLETFDQILGDPSNLFESEYIGLENLRKQYFKELIESINLNSHSDFFAWFDDALTDLISDLIPVRAKFLGINNVIESHVLERNKNRYQFDKMFAVNEYDSAGYFAEGADLGLKNIDSE